MRARGVECIFGVFKFCMKWVFSCLSFWCIIMPSGMTDVNSFCWLLINFFAATEGRVFVVPSSDFRKYAGFINVHGCYVASGT